METARRRTDLERRAGAGNLPPPLRVEWYETLTSTSDFVKERASGGEAAGLVVVADAQTRGRGRLGRKWHSPAGGGLWFSMLLRPAIPPREAPALTPLTGRLLADFLEKRFDLEVTIKPPNDLMIAGRKVAGILCEASVSEGTSLDYVVVGIGLNLKSAFPPELAAIATSLEEHVRPADLPGGPELLGELLHSTAPTLLAYPSPPCGGRLLRSMTPERMRMEARSPVRSRPPTAQRPRNRNGGYPS